MSIHRRRLLEAGAALSGAGLVGTLGFPKSAMSQNKITLRFTPEFDLSVFDPIVNTGLSTLQHGYMVYDTLFALDSEYAPQPQMVKSFTVSPDKLVYDFVLRPGLKFHDGTPVRGLDCAASIRRWGARDVIGRTMMKRVVEIVARSDGFVIKLSQPYPILVSALAKISSNVCFIMREKEALTDPNTPITEVIGSGPFTFNRAELVPGAKVVYEKFRDYVPRSEPASGYAGGKVVKVDRVEWLIIPDASTQINALMAGEIDVLSAPPLEMLGTLSGNKKVAIKDINAQGWFAYLRTNALYPPFNDPRARQALAHMISQKDFMSVAAGPKSNWNECWEFLVCGSKMGSAGGIAGYKTPNPSLARKLLAESGYKGEPIVVLNPTDNQILGGIAELLIDVLRSNGVKVEPRAGDLATVFSMRGRRQPPSEGGWHIFATRSLGLELNNPVSSFALASPCDVDTEGKRSGWFGWHCDQKLEDLRAAWVEAGTEPQRLAVAKNIQLRAAEMFPYIPLGQLKTPVALRSDLKGLINMPIVVFWNLERQT